MTEPAYDRGAPAPDPYVRAPGATGAMWADVPGPDPAGPVIEMERVVKRFGAVPVLDGLSLSVGRGEVHGFLGRNGAGKSTAIRILMGITGMDAGQVRLFGEPLSGHVVAARRRIGYVAQEQHMYPWMTPRALARFVRGFYPKWDERRWRGLNEAFGLPPKRRLGTFSGGMRAKLALALALATRPDLLILDEPTAGMDPVARREFLDLVREQTAREGATVFFSTHLIDEIEAIATRISIVESGRAVHEGALGPLRASIAGYSIDVADDVPGSLPGEFAQARLRTLEDVVRVGRRHLVLQYPGPVPPVRPSMLAPGWRADRLTLEDVFVALVGGGGSASGARASA